jgi:L-ribulose-5-phosphate 4-epimerase
MLEPLKEKVTEANRELVRQGLVTLTWGNASGISENREHVVIKPSGVDYRSMTPDHMVVVDLSGRVVEGSLNPSSDLPTHLLLYRHFSKVGGITHTHSLHATMFAQARQEIACYGTTHADHFYGPIPVTRPLTETEVKEDYERHTGTVIVERFAYLSFEEMPAVLVAGHGPFTWGDDVHASVKNAVALEAVAQMALGTQLLRTPSVPLESHVLEKHYSRKHGENAYYGQE